MESELLHSSDDDELGVIVVTESLPFTFFFPRPRRFAESFFAGGGGDEGEVRTFFSEVAGIAFAGADSGMLNFVIGLPSCLGELVAELLSLEL